MPMEITTSILDSVLVLGETALGISIYRDVICSVFPNRRQELHDYLAVVLDLAVRFGGTLFQEYHRQFSAKASSRLEQRNVATYWGALDLELYCRVSSGTVAVSCSLCSNPAHPASLCTVAMARPSTSKAHVAKAAPLSLLGLPNTPPPQICRNNFEPRVTGAHGSHYGKDLTFH